MDSELQNRMRELYDMIGTLDTTLSTLNTSISTVNTSWGTATTAINRLISKVPKPTSIDSIVTSSSPTFGMLFYELGKSALLTGASSAANQIWSLTCDGGTYIYSYDTDYEGISRVSVSGGAFTYFWKPAGGIEHSVVGYDETNGRLLVYYQPSRINTTHTIYVVATDGSTTSSYDVDPETALGWTGTGEFASHRAGAWDETTGYMYVVYRKYDGSAYTRTYGLCGIDPDTGTVMSATSIGCMTVPRDMEIDSGYLYISHIQPFSWVAQYTLSSGTANMMGAIATTKEPRNAFCYDTSRNKWYFMHLSGMDDGTSDWKYIWYRGLAYKDRYAIEDSIVSNDANYNNATIGATASQLVAANNAREKVIIQNDDLNRTIYIGSDSSVTTSNGLPVLPMRGWNISGYSGAIWLIADGAGADIRYLEVW